MSARRWRLCLCVIVALALGLRLAVALGPSVVLWGDPVDYQRHAVAIAASGSYPPTQLASPGTPSAFRPPSYPFLLGGLYAVLGVHPLAGRVLGALLGTLCVVLIALLGEALWNRRVGLLAAGLAAVYFPMVALNCSLLSESLFLPLEIAFALCLAACVRRPGEWRWAPLSGAVCGLAVLTRGVADAWVLIAIAAAVLAVRGARARVRQGLAVLAAFALVVSPWLIRDGIVFHQFVPLTTEGGFTLAGQYNGQAGADNSFTAVSRLPTTQVPAIEHQVHRLLARPGGLNEAQLDQVLRSDAVRYLRAHPVHLATAVWLDWLRLFDLGRGHSFTTGVVDRELNLPVGLRRPTTIFAQVISLVAVLVLAAAALGRVLPARRRESRLGSLLARIRLGPWWLWAIPLLALILTVPSVGNQLKRAPLDPFLILLVAVGADAVLATVLPRRARVANMRESEQGVETWRMT